MFTGLVQEMGSVQEVQHGPPGVRLTVASALADRLRVGDSVAVNGVCLTSRSVQDHAFTADIMRATLQASSLGELRSGSLVNLELPLRAGDPLGGHFVQGHVDGVGRVAAVDEDGFARRIEISAAQDLFRYVVVRGSVAVDGVSLTVVDVQSGSFTVSLIPETLERTNLGRVGPGQSVNLEVDVLAKYVEKLVRRP